MEAIHNSFIDEQVNEPTVMAFTTTGKPKVTNFSQDGSPNESLKRKSAPNTIGKTGYRFGLLKAMSKSQQQKIVKTAGLTCNNCNTAGHISLDCSRAKAPSSSKVAETLYKALLSKIPEEEIQAFLASHTNHWSQRPCHGRPPRSPSNTAAQWIYDTGLNHEALTPFKEDFEDSRPYSVVIDGAFAVRSATSYTRVTFLKHKNDFAPRAQVLIERLRREFNHTEHDPIVMEIRADQGGEIWNPEFRNWFRDQGMDRHRLLVD
ncbi:hypothetical protein HDU67_001169 [Dinochytrium kinnereticum]|nr:hypothetical protein HDU67_001169 [Dinochytrium kinnereticum]